MAIEDLRIARELVDIERFVRMPEDMYEELVLDLVLDLCDLMAMAEFLKVFADIPFVWESPALPWSCRIDHAFVVVIEEDAGSGLVVFEDERSPVLGESCIFLNKLVERDIEQLCGVGHFLFCSPDDAFPFAAVSTRLAGEVFHGWLFFEEFLECIDCCVDQLGTAFRSD